MKTIQTTLSIFLILIMSQTIGAQSDTSAQYMSTDQNVLQFQYYQFDRMYTLKTDLECLNCTEKNLYVYLNIDQEEDIYLIPHYEDFIKLNINENLISYGINAENKVEVYLQNPRGGSPWSTLTFTHFSISYKISREEFGPSKNSLADQ